MGPLYPAFSLYNEDDQLSLSPPRQPSLETDLIGSSRWGTGSAERVMQRVQTLHTLLCSIVDPLSEEDGLNPQLISEYCRRWSLWRNDIGLRTLRVDGDLIVVLVSPAVCLAFTENRSVPEFSRFLIPCRYSIGDLLQWENSQLTVIGVGRHRLWLQKSSNGRFLHRIFA